MKEQIIRIEQEIIRKNDFDINSFIEDCKENFLQTKDELVKYEYLPKSENKNETIILYVKTKQILPMVPSYQIVLGGLQMVNTKYENYFKVYNINPSMIDLSEE